MAIIVIRLHPVEPVDGPLFAAYLDGLVIEVSDRSFADPAGTAPGSALGSATYYDPAGAQAGDSTIVQHIDLLTLLPLSAATAAIDVPDPPYNGEYLSRDLLVKVTRMQGGANQTIVQHDINFNVELDLTDAMPAQGFNDPITYSQLGPVALYLPLPKPLIGLAPGVAYLEVATDGTPPPYAAVLDAINKVLAGDPGAPVPDPKTLTPEQSRHIAWEIVSNRTLDPFPVPPEAIEDLYTGSNDPHKDDRRKFESDLLTYYAVHNTRADVLSKFIYSVACALGSNQTSKDATQVGFSFPILPGLTPVGEHVRTATVVISQ